MYRITNRFARLFLLLVLLLVSHEAEAQKVTIAEDFPYVYVLPESRSKVPTVSDSIFYRNARGVIFPVNRYYLPQGDAWIQELKEKVEKWAHANDLELRHIEMRGASSPEGSIERNNMLAENRAKALQDTLRNIFRVGYMLVDPKVKDNPEDYKALLFEMQKQNDAELPVVADILNRYDFDRIKVKDALRRYNGGKLWARLLQQYFPSIRYARVLLYFAPKKLALSRFQYQDLPLDSVGLKYVDMDFMLLPLDTMPAMEMPRRRVLALRTNLLYDFLYMPRYGWAPSPNLVVEFFPKKGRFSYNFEMTYPDWEEWPDPQHFWQIHDYKFSVRCYTRRHKVAPRDTKGFPNEHVRDYFRGFYVGPYIQAGRYGIGFNKDDGWEGEYIGGGIELGYTLPLSKTNRWRLEFTAAVGGLISKYDPYVWGNPVTGEVDGLYYYDWTHSADYFIKRNHRFTWLGPTELGIHLTYDLLYKRVKKKGVSTRRWEK